MSDSTLASTSQLPKFVGKYKIIRMIARSNDIVYEAVDPNLGRHVALKELILAPDLSGAARRERIERFQREAKAAGALQHPNIVTIFEVGQHLEHRFIAMEYLVGQTLRETISVGGPMSINDAVRVALQLCDALGYAHAQGVVHRDVKPDNIHLVPPGNTVKLTDFGIARVLSEPSITAAGQIFGTPSYMSPEQLTSRLVDHRSDIFSTAVVIFEMLTGKKPFRGDSVVAVTYQIMHAEVTMPPSIPPGIAAILSRALVKDPDLRYQNMRSLAADLRQELAFHDSPRHVPIGSPPAATSGDIDPSRTLIMTSEQESPEPDSDATVLLGGGAAPTVQAAQSTASGSRTIAQANVRQESMPLPMATGSLLTAIDTDERVRHALLRIAASTVLIAILICATIWGLVQGVERHGENARHASALIRYDAALSAAASGDLVTAISKYRAAMLVLDPTDELYDRCREGIADCYTAEGTNAQSAGNITEAQESYNEAIAIYYDNPIAHYDLATLFKGDGDQLDMLREYTLAHDVDPRSIAGVAATSAAQQGYLALGDQNFNNGDPARARQNWQRVLDLDPGSPLADQARTRLSSNAQ